MRRGKQKKMDISYSLDDDENDQLDSGYVEQKRRKTKGAKGPRKVQNKKTKKISQSQDQNSESQNIIEFKHNDEEVKQHRRPSFIQRWNGIDNELEIFSQQYKEMSPMLKIYWQTKSKNMNAIIFLQLGGMEFFAFQNDAIILHEMFKKKLKHYSDYLMVNFWCKEIILAKQELFQKNIAVLIMNQINDPQYKIKYNLIRREVNEVITPGIHLQMEDKVYRQRWFMGCYISEPKDSSFKIKNLQEKQSEPTSDEKSVKSCVVLLDTETNKFFIQQFQVDQKLHGIRQVINRYRPVQLLIRKTNSIYSKVLKQIARQICEPYLIQLTYERDHQKVDQTLNKFIETSNSPIFKQLLGVAKKQKTFNNNFQMFSTVKCLDLIYEYMSNLKLREKIFDQGIFKLSCFNKIKLKPFFDSQVYENLQIFRIKNEDEGQGKQGTLVAFLDHCKTQSGKKLLTRWLNEPLINYQAILQRQSCLKQIVQSHQYPKIMAIHEMLIAYEKLQRKIGDVYHWVVSKDNKLIKSLWNEIDFQKGYDQKKNPLINRIKQIVKILNMLTQFQGLLSRLKQFDLKSAYFQRFTKISSLTLNAASKIQKGEKQLVDIPEIKKIIASISEKIDYDQVNDYLEPTPGTSPIYDRQKKLKIEVQQKLQQELAKWRRDLNCPKISYVSVRARNQLQIPKAILKSMKNKPKQLIFSSQTSAYERYTTSVTIALSAQLISHEQVIVKSYQPFMHDIIREFCRWKIIWNKYTDAVGQLDLLISLAFVAKNMGTKCLPTFLPDNQQSKMSIIKARHPGLIQLKQNKVIQNSLKMNQKQRFLLLTGPNMGGKSTLLRQTCLLAILAQIGSYVPCHQYQTIVFDQIFCRIGSSDKLIEGKSTFYVQLQQTNRILKQATSSSLVIIDQLGRGTSTYDGMAIAQATIKYFLNQIGCYTLFSTHYMPITRDFVSNSEVKCVKMSYRLIDSQKSQKQQLKLKEETNEERLQFLYQIEHGIAEKSFANNVARMVGLPTQILFQADSKANWIAKAHENDQNRWIKSKKILNCLDEIFYLEKNNRSDNQKQIEI